MGSMKYVDLRQTIRKTRVSFIAVILFVGISIGTLLGTNWSGPAVVHLTNNYYDGHGVADLTVTSASGFTQETVEAIFVLTILITRMRRHPAAHRILQPIRPPGHRPFQL